jgi:DnaJ-class molecular chaperone
MAGFVVIVGIIVIGIWQLSVRRHPVRRCPSCKGSKHNAGSTDSRWGICRRCGGKGEIRRLGA